MPRQYHNGARSRKAALVYLQGGLTLKTVAQRFAIDESTVRAAVVRLRAVQRNAWPEDEVTC